MELNFTLKELIHSDIADKNKICNIPSVEEYDNLMLLIVNVLQPVRDHFKQPVIVSSGYRSKRVNKLVGGAVTSNHIDGCAADFTVKNYSVETVYNWIKNKSGLKYTELIQEKGKWIHCAYNRNYLPCENMRYNGKMYIED